MLGRNWLLPPGQKRYQVRRADGAYSQTDLGSNPSSMGLQFLPPLAWSIRWVCSPLPLRRAVPSRADAVAGMDTVPINPLHPHELASTEGPVRPVAA